MRRHLAVQPKGGAVELTVGRVLPARPAIVAPLAADGNTGSRQITQMQMNSPYRCFERFALRISDPPPECSHPLMLSCVQDVADISDVHYCRLMA